MTTHDEQSEIQARALGRLLREAITSELDERDRARDAAIGVQGIEPAGEVVTPLHGEGSARLTAEDRRWLDRSEEQLTAKVRGKMPSAAVISALEKAQAEQAFDDFDEVRRARSKKARIALLAGGLGLAAAALLALSLSFTPSAAPSVLNYSVEGQGIRAATSGRVVAPQDADRTLRFSDGSVLTLDESSSLRVRQTDEHGALVVMERGRLKSLVEHREKTSWSVFAGPYEIQVVGTAFSTEWSPEQQKLVVDLEEGTVRVVGGEIDRHVVLEPGERLIAQANRPWSISASSATEEVRALDVTSPPDPAASPDDAGPDDALPPTARPTDFPSPSWDELLADGKFALIMQEASAFGLARCIASCPIGKLRALADAARYTGDFSTAESALLSLRQRSPRESVRAGYLLGSLHEARGQHTEALRYYAGYASEAPAGSFSAEALAGRMRAEHALGRRTDAKARASEYLDRYPSGASAATARRILNKK